MEYIVDTEIVALILNKPIDDESVALYMNKYIDKIAGITDKVIYAHLSRNHKYTDIQIKEELERMANERLEDDSPLFDTDLEMKIDQKVNEFNEQIYLYYRSRLSDDQKEKINMHIREIQVEIDRLYDEEKAVVNEVLDEVLDEYKTTGTVQPWDDSKEVDKEQMGDEVSVQQVSPKKQITVNLTQTPNVDPVLGV